MSSPRTRRPARPADAPRRAIGYVRVSTGEQVESGNGLEAQRTSLSSYADRNGWTLELTGDEGISGATVTKRPALTDALARLDAGEADVLFATKLDRVSRSVRDFAGLLDRAERNGWSIVLLDLGDTSTPSGEMTANIIASAAQYERRLIGQRTREALAARKARGERHGIPSALPGEVLARIVAEDAAGRSRRAIAAGLMADGVVTARGNTTWHASTVQAVLRGQDAAVLTSR